MHVIRDLWTAVIALSNWVSLSPFSDNGFQQKPIGTSHHLTFDESVAKPGGPRYDPPGSNIDGFRCDYTRMGPGWFDCTDRYTGCWLMNKDGRVFDINTDYEADVPLGITRNYTLYVSDGSINADGINFPEAKLFNGSFPGPLLEACWGDTLNITVVNNLALNGTSIHWHGIRQNRTNPMDGVNGITQCPIAPGSSANYVWKATQYGSSWYHSHYSVQYADGLQAPITLHGPTSAHFDEAIHPLLITDWLHNSAFEAQFTQTLRPTLLIDGIGNYTRFSGNKSDLVIPNPYTMIFNRTAPNPKTGARRYLLRIINTSYSSQITFSIDNHYLTIVETDFVPVEPKTVTSVLVAIGQRYLIIVEAKPQGGTENPLPETNNFWIRTLGSGCRDDVTGIEGYDRVGILRYDNSSTEDPVSVPWPNIPADCVDSLSTTLNTVYNWTVYPPSNGVGGESFQVTFNGSTLQYALAKFAFQKPNASDFVPFQTTYGNPTVLNLDNTRDDWPTGWVVIPENFTDTDFVYFVLSGGSHPIHLHGHDFAILDYKDNATFSPGSLKDVYHGPIRRDVVLLPPTGYVVIAFKTDNPGVWLMHCHIAFHASSGLSLQVMERQADANKIWPPGQSSILSDTQQVCASWNSWAYDCRNFWPGKIGNNYPACEDATMLQNDSGV